MTTSTLSLFLAGLLLKYNFVVSRLKHLTPKTTSLGNFKMWTTIFLPSKLTAILGNLSSLLKLKKNRLNVKYVDFHSFLDTLYNVGLFFQNQFKNGCWQTAVWSFCFPWRTPASQNLCNVIPNCQVYQYTFLTARYTSIHS